MATQRSRDPKMRRAERAAASALPAQELRPLARTARIALIEREVRERLSRAALDLLFEKAEVISEGQCTSRGERPVYLGSTMLTFDLEALAPFLREPCDAATARRTTLLLAVDGEVARRVRQVAAAEAARLAGRPPQSVNAELAVRSVGARVYVDVDVEAAL